MSINELLKTGANIQLVINAIDLKEAFMQWSNDMEQKPERPKEENLLSVKETAEKLGVEPGTLWRWDRQGYLKKVKIGRVVRYKESDVLKLLEG